MWRWWVRLRTVLLFVAIAAVFVIGFFLYRSWYQEITCKSIRTHGRRSRRRSGGEPG